MIDSLFYWLFGEPLSVVDGLKYLGYCVIFGLALHGFIVKGD